MYNVDDILARLQNGEKLEDIGNELANAMNAAQEKYVAIQKAEEEKRAAEAEKARQAQRTATRRKMLWNVLDAIRQYANYTNYSVVVNDWLAAATEEDIADLDAQMIELLKTFEMLSQLNFAVAPKQENIQKDTKKVAAVNPDKALGDFLKMMGW
jgi:hypothetical protein